MATKDVDGLEPQQRIFCLEYLSVLPRNGKQAAIRAGYSAKTAEVQASRLLSQAKVKAFLEKRMAGVYKKLELSAVNVREEMWKLGSANMDDFVRRTPDGEIYTDFSAVGRDQMAAVQEVTVDTYMEGRGDDAREVKRVKFKLADKRAPLNDLGKDFGLFRSRVELTGPNGGPIKTEDVTPNPIDVKKLKPAQREALREALMAAKRAGAKKAA